MPDQIAEPGKRHEDLTTDQGLLFTVLVHYHYPELLCRYHRPASYKRLGWEQPTSKKHPKPTPIPF